MTYYRSLYAYTFTFYTTKSLFKLLKVLQQALASLHKTIITSCKNIKTCLLSMKG